MSAAELLSPLELHLGRLLERDRPVLDLAAALVWEHAPETTRPTPGGAAMTMSATRAVLVVGWVMVLFALGILIEGKIDGDDVSLLAAVVAAGGGFVAALAAYVSWREKR